MSEQQQTRTIQQALSLAVQHHNAGRLSEAENVYRQILQNNPNQPAALHLLGVIAHQVGKNEIAIELISKALVIQPDLAEGHNNLGRALQAQGKPQEAIASYQKALALKSDYAEPHYNLGVTLQTLGKLDDALASHQMALDITPDYAEAHFNIGNLLKKLGKLDDAANGYHRALAIRPDFLEAHNNLGATLLGLGKPEDAAASCQRALGLKPDYPEAHNNLGVALHHLGKLEDAVASCQKALTLQPDYAEAHYNLGNVLQEMGELDDAITSYQKALTLKPGYPEAHYNLGSVLNGQGNVDDAAKQIDLALSYEAGKDGWRISKALLLPPIPYSKQDIQVRRDTLAEAVKGLMKQNLTVPDPVLDVGITNFYLSYHNQNNRVLVKDIAKLHIAACPRLTYEAKHCRFPQRGPKDVLRIGFISAHLYGQHTIGRLFQGIIQYLSRDQFQVTVFQPLRKQDSISKAVDQAADKVIRLYGDLERNQDLIEDEKLDILFYPDIGMSTLTYFLAFARLAPVQAVSWGHPDTTGIPNIDYFLSSEQFETTNASKHYSEQLITLQNVPTYYFRPNPPKNKYVRGDYGLPNGVRLYVCPQTLFKFHPEFDDILGELLRRDPGGRVVLIADEKNGNWKTLLLERLFRSLPEVASNVIFVSKISHEKFLGLLVLADALLDIPSFSGGNSALEAFAMGAPIVTWPQDFMRGRLTAALYKQMGLSDLIATDSESYLRLALKLARNANFKRRMQDDIEANSHKLYERHDVVREMEIFFASAYQACLEGTTLTNPTIFK